ncbi:hypothetical protein [Candidatus Kuenenia sp.]
MKKLFLILCFLIAMMNCAIGEQMIGIWIGCEGRAEEITGKVILKVL